MILNGAQILIEVLVEQGVDIIFGYPGGAVLNIYDELFDNEERIRHILTSHEQGAAHAADGYSRATGKQAWYLPHQARINKFSYRDSNSLYGFNTYGSYYWQCKYRFDWKRLFKRCTLQALPFLLLSITLC